MTKFGMIGSGSWATALSKLIHYNGHPLNWWIRNEERIKDFERSGHNPRYLRSVSFNTELIHFSTDLNEIIRQSDTIVLAVPSAYVADTLKALPENIFHDKQIVSAVKGIIPGENMLVNDYLHQSFTVELKQYHTILGPCHAEEVANEKLSYLTFSGLDKATTQQLSSYFATPFLKTIINQDVIGVQYAAVLKNIYAIGAGIAHGLGYGDNFQSVLIANCGDEMAGFLRKIGQSVEVGSSAQPATTNEKESRVVTNYAASVYLGDLLVTCYSMYSRNRTFGAMIGKGYSVRNAQIEMDMTPEGYHASRCIHDINQKVSARMPIAEAMYDILWNHQPPREMYRNIESILV